MAAGQYQQRPTAREGGLFKREWFANPAKFAPDGIATKSAPGILPAPFSLDQDPD